MAPFNQFQIDSSPLKDDLNQFRIKEQEPVPSFQETGTGVVLRKGDLRSPNFSSGSSGWQIDSEGLAEFRSLTASTLKSVRCFLAGESIGVGDAVFTGTGTKLTTTGDDIGAAAVGADTLTNTNWFGRLMNLDSGTQSLIGVTVEFNSVSSPDGDIIVGVRHNDNIDGGDLITVTRDAGTLSAGQETFNFSTPLLVEEGQQIFVYCGRQNGTSGSITLEHEEATGLKYSSTNSGDTFPTTTSNDRVKFRTRESSYASGRIYKTLATSADEESDNFVGFARTKISKFDLGDVIVSGVATEVSTVTDPGFYYLSDTAGEVSTSPGTNTRKVGMGLQAEELIINNNW